MRIIFSLICCGFLSACAAQMPTQAEQKEAVVVHQQLRSKHGASPLVWNNKLSRYAARHASACYFKHSKGPYGENLAAGFPSISSAIKAWYGEKNMYNYGRPGFAESTGHFTQVVWKSSREIGCAFVECNGKHGTPGKYLVCEYSPAGNVVNDGYFKRNVLPA